MKGLSPYFRWMGLLCFHVAQTWVESSHESSGVVSVWKMWECCDVFMVEQGVFLAGQ